MEIITIKWQWKIIHSLIYEKFCMVATDTQKSLFEVYCCGKFPRGYTNNLDTVEEMQTDVYLILDFVYNNDIHL